MTSMIRLLEISRGAEIATHSLASLPFSAVAAEVSNLSAAKTSSRPTSISEIALKRLSVTPAWQHKLSEKHLGKVPSQSETVRYFDRSRQTRRVLLDCLWMWSGTALICLALAGLLRYFETIEQGASRMQRYMFNTISNGLLLVLGIAFAAQFKQYCEMMRWRFLASSYWTLAEFDEVLDCDSWRSAIRLIARKRNKSWLPGKLQVVAAAWVLTFAIFNIISAALGLTYALETGDTGAHLTWGDVTVAKFSVDIDPYPDYTYAGQLGTTLTEKEEVKQATLPRQFDKDTIYFQNSPEALWWYRFLDFHPITYFPYGSQRSINCSASCAPLTLQFADRAGSDGRFDECDPSDDTFTFDIFWLDGTNSKRCLTLSTWPSDLGTYWVANRTSIENSSCGPRCAQLLVYQSVGQDRAMHRLWECNSTIGDIEGARSTEYQNPDLFEIQDDIARDIAGSIGRSKIKGLVGSNSGSELELNQVLGGANSQNDADHHDNTTNIESWIMRFTTGAIAAYDQYYGGAETMMNVTGLSPSAPLVVHVKWRQAGPILLGIPLVQLLMLFGVVWYSGKAIILEPSYLTAAHLLYPVMEKLGKRGVLMTVEEMTEAMGPDFKVSYTVRPSADEPGHHNKDFVRDLALIEESEGFGYIRGKMPEGRYG